MKHKVKGVRRTDGGLNIYLDGKKVEPYKSQAVWNHSPTGFNAGYLGSGPAQTALGILLEVTDQNTAVNLHQDFKRQYLSNPEYLTCTTFEFEFEL